MIQVSVKAVQRVVVGYISSRGIKEFGLAQGLETVV